MIIFESLLNLILFLKERRFMTYNKLAMVIHIEQSTF